MMYNNLLNKDLDLDIYYQDSIIMSLHSFTPIQLDDSHKFFILNECRGDLDKSFEYLFDKNGNLNLLNYQYSLTGKFNSQIEFKVYYLDFNIIKSAGDRGTLIITDVNVKGEFIEL